MTYKIECYFHRDLACNEPGHSTLSPVPINAHQGELVCITLNQQGTLVATASKKVMLLLDDFEQILAKHM